MSQRLESSYLPMSDFNKNFNNKAESQWRSEERHTQGAGGGSIVLTGSGSWSYRTPQSPRNWTLWCGKSPSEI